MADKTDAERLAVIETNIEYIKRAVAILTIPVKP